MAKYWLTRFIYGRECTRYWYIFVQKRNKLSNGGVEDHYLPQVSIWCVYHHCWRINNNTPLLRIFVEIYKNIRLCIWYLSVWNKDYHVVHDILFIEMAKRSLLCWWSLQTPFDQYCYHILTIYWEEFFIGE